MAHTGLLNIKKKIPIFLQSLFQIWPRTPSTGSGKDCVSMTTRLCWRQCGIQTRCAVSTSWTPGSLAPPTWGSTGGGEEQQPYLFTHQPTSQYHSIVPVDLNELSILGMLMCYYHNTTQWLLQCCYSVITEWVR